MKHPRTISKFSAYLLALGLITIAAPATGQLVDGTIRISSFTIEFDNQVVGRLVVVGCDNTSPPTGYSAGKEYWTWTSGTPWRGAFKLVPSGTVPSYSSYTWQTFPHEHFDLSGTVPMPSVSPAPSDEFYKVQIASGGGWVDQGYMWLDVGSPSVQVWYGVDLTDDLVGNGGQIRFQSVEPPDPGDEDVYLLE